MIGDVVYFGVYRQALGELCFCGMEFVVGRS